MIITPISSARAAGSFLNPQITSILPVPISLLQAPCSKLLLEVCRIGSNPFTATMPKPVAKPTSYSDFYLPADRFFAANLPNALTYDDVSLATLHSEILPRDTELATSLSESLRLQIPILSSDMDTVTESRMAIAMALNGGLGLIHYNLPAKDQIREVARVKHHVHGLIQDPMTVAPGASIGEVLQMIEQRRFDFRTFPVADEAGRLVGLLSGNVVKDRYRSKLVSEVMTPRKQLLTMEEKRIASDPIKAEAM